MMLIEETFSQFREDIVIASVLAGSGNSYSRYFIDVGANDGKSWSNSWLYGLQGWNLMLVETIPKFAQHCRDLYHGNSKVIVEEKAISDTEGTVDFFMTDEPGRDLLQMGSSLSASGVPFGLKTSQTTVQTIPLHRLLRQYDVPKDFAVLSVDAEGHDLAVLETTDLDTWRPALICVEMMYAQPMDPVYSPIDDFLRSKGYRYAVHTPANAMYVRT